MMEGHLYEETKPNHWEISPYELGREYAYHHRVSGEAAGWLVAYGVALIWATSEGASLHIDPKIGPKEPSVNHSALITRPLVVTSVAAILHAGVCVVFHILARRVWNGDDHEDPAKRVGPHQPYRPTPLGMILNALLALVAGTVWYSLIFCMFNYTSLFLKPKETAVLAAMCASFGWVPGACMYGFPTLGWGGIDGVDGTKYWNYWEWQRVLFMGCNAPWRPADASWFLGFWGTSLGCWFGAMPIPLDWGRVWQPYPITLVYCACVGMCGGQVIGIVWSVAKWYARDGNVLGFGGEANEREKRGKWVEQVEQEEVEIRERGKRNAEFRRKRRKGERERRRREREAEEAEEAEMEKED